MSDNYGLRAAKHRQDVRYPWHESSESLPTTGTTQPQQFSAKAFLRLLSMNLCSAIFGYSIVMAVLVQRAPPSDNVLEGRLSLLISVPIAGMVFLWESTSFAIAYSRGRTQQYLLLDVAAEALLAVGSTICAIGAAFQAARHRAFNETTSGDRFEDVGPGIGLAVILGALTISCLGIMTFSIVEWNQRRGKILVRYLAVLLHLVNAGKQIIIDTDLFSDVDDAGALLLAVSASKAQLLAVNVNTQSSYSAIAASAIVARYARVGMPIGLRRPITNDTFLDTFTYELGEFASKVAYHWSAEPVPWGHADLAQDPVHLYRTVLAAALNESITIISIGFLESLADLLESGPDQISPMTGLELVAAKVTELVVMGGEYPAGNEWNFYGSNATASAYVINNWKGRITYAGFELGANVYSGGRLMSEGPKSDPVRAAYLYYTYNTSRSSWDPLAVMYALDGLGDMFEYGNEFGYNHVSPNGSNSWVFDRAVQNQHWLRLKVPNTTAADMLDNLYLRGAWEAEERWGKGAEDGQKGRHLEL